MTSDRLKKLEERKAAIQQEINREKSKLDKAERAKDTRRKILVGAYCLELAEKDEATYKKLITGLDAFLSRDADRALFGLSLKKLGEG